jgi:hypothetical protein
MLIVQFEIQNKNDNDTLSINLLIIYNSLVSSYLESSFKLSLQKKTTFNAVSFIVVLLKRH